MKIAALLPLALAALLCACGAPACTSEVAGPSINYEAQFYHTTSGLFLQQQRSELAETDALLDRLSKLENTPEALAYLQGYLDGISGNVNGSLSPPAAPSGFTPPKRPCRKCSLMGSTSPT